MENERTHVGMLAGSVRAERSDGSFDLVRSVLDELPTLVGITNGAGRTEFVNRRVLEYFNKSFEEFEVWENAGLLHPDDLPAVVEAWTRALDSGTPFDMECRLRRGDGVHRWFHMRTSPAHDAEGRIVAWHTISLDIDDRKRVELELAGEKQLLEMIASGRPLPDVLHALCEFFETAAAGCLCGVYPIDWSGPTFQNGVAPSLPASYIAPIEGLPVRPDVAPCGIAAHARTQVIVQDIESDPHWRGSSYRTHVLTHGLRSVWSSPISSLDGRVLGTLCIYRRTPATPSPHEQELIAQVTHIASIAIDRERKEAELRRSEAFLAQAQRLTLTGSLWWKTATNEIIWSEESYRLLDYPVTVTPSVELILNRCHPDDVPLVLEQIGAGVRDGVNMDYEHRLLMPNGVVKHIHVVLQNVGFNAAAPEFIGAVTDLTERKRAEEKLRKSEAYLAEAQKLSLTGSFGWSVADDRHYWSDQTFRIFGYDPSVTVTLPLILERVHPQDLEVVRHVIVQATADARDFDYECRLQMPDGAVKQVHVVAHGAGDAKGRVEYIGAIQDVTAQRRSDEALGKLRSELAHVTRVTSLGTLTAAIAHEVNQPLSGIITNASTCLRMLGCDPPNVEGARETARRTIRDANRASEVITRLRSLFTKQAHAMEPVDLNDATREVLTLSRSELQRSRAVIRPELAEDLPMVMGDRVQLQQVIMNLLRNSSEAMSGVDERPREIVIRTGPDEDRVVMSVQDSGVGFGPQSAEKLFDAFYTTKQNGMGIGLSVSRSIIERHGGRLWAVPNDGPGVTFSFAIPRGPEEIINTGQPDAFSTPRVAQEAHAMRTE